METESPEQFDLSGVQTLRLGRQAKPKWAKALYFVAVAAVGFGTLLELKLENYSAREMPHAQPSPEIPCAQPAPPEVPYAQPAPPEVPYVHPQRGFPYFGQTVQKDPIVAYLDVDPRDSQMVKAAPQLKSIYNSTVVLMAFDKYGVALWSGSGTVLKNTDVGGYPAVMTVRHMVDYAVDGAEGAFMVAYTNSGFVLGALKPLEGTKTVEGYRQDGPVLMAFAPRFSMDRAMIKKIPGVEVAHTLSASPIFSVFGGPKNGGVGVGPGDSGGGVYVKEDGQYKLAAVVSADTPRFLGPYIPVESKEALPPNEAQMVSNGHQYAVVRSQTGSVVSSVGEGAVPEELKKISTNNAFYNVVKSVPSQDVVAFGFGLDVATVLSGRLYQDSYNATFSKEVIRSSFRASLRENAVEIKDRAETEWKILHKNNFRRHPAPTARAERKKPGLSMNTGM